VSNKYDYGQAIKVSATFKNDAGAPTDPGTITLKVKGPDAVIQTYTYGAAQVTRESAGVYSKVITLNQEGRWYYRYEGTGTVQAAEEKDVLVVDSAFY